MGRKQSGRTPARTGLMALALGWILATPAYGSNLDTIGVTLLRTTTTNLDGAGIRAGQAEAGTPTWEVNPGAAGIGLPVSGFTYYATNVTASTYPNSLGVESGHADTVGGFFYGLPGGVSTNVAHVDNYEANYFALVAVPSLTAINEVVMNQSFNFVGASPSEQQAVDTAYDNYAAQYGTLFVTGVGDGGAVNAPATCYNGIGVGAYQGATSTGPTPDNSRAKPDLTAPADATSYSAPQVSGATVLLLQAGLRGDGGSDVSSAADMRTLKALLLNGAVKPSDWASPAPSPLDPRYGAGVLNVFNSYRQLTGGKHGFITSSSVPKGNPHPPTGATGNVASLSGWDFNTVSGSLLNDAVNHYYFSLTGAGPFTGTVTLVWNRQAGQTAINELDLYLYDASTGAMLAYSSNAVDNVKHLFLPQLAPGRYDVQMLKKGGLTVSSSETYALAYEFFALPLSLSRAGGNQVVLSWPLYPAGFVLEATSSLTPPVTWSPVNPAPVVTSNQNQVTVNAASSGQFFRLNRP